MYRRFNNFRKNNQRKNSNQSSWSKSEFLRTIDSINAQRRNTVGTASGVYAPVHKFDDFPIYEQLKKNIFYKGYSLPTPIQDQAIPVILQGKDIIGIANTGTGKTVAFLIPLIDKVFKNRDQKVLVIAPTRELALQINDEFIYFAKGSGIKSALCIGGVSMFRQKSELRQNANFIIGTPGRIKDLVRNNYLHLSQFQNVVLDETDRMVEIGFIEDIKYFISLLPKIRQSLFFSATVSKKVQDILENFVHDPIAVSVKQQDLSQNIDHKVIKVIDNSKKIDQLHELLIQEGINKTLIFGRTKWGVQKLADNLEKRGFKVGAIHGNKRQNQRQRTLDKFKRNEINILLATDVASRGLDIEDISHVINYDMPGSMEDYIHRSGRTGRANKKGVALTFVE